MYMIVFPYSAFNCILWVRMSWLLLLSNESNINRSWLPRCFRLIITTTYPSISWARQKFCTENISSVSRSYGVHQLKDKSWSSLVNKTITWGKEPYTCTDLVHSLQAEQWKKKGDFYLLEFLYSVATLFFISLCYTVASTPGLLKIKGFPQHYGPMKYSTLFFKMEQFYIVQKISKKKVDTNF